MRQNAFACCCFVSVNSEHSFMVKDTLNHFSDLFHIIKKIVCYCITFYIFHEKLQLILYH